MKISEMRLLSDEELKTKIMDSRQELDEPAFPGDHRSAN